MRDVSKLVECCATSDSLSDVPMNLMPNILILTLRALESNGEVSVMRIIESENLTIGFRMLTCLRMKVEGGVVDYASIPKN